jgi:Asp-tRNA(Asn)/Glu-tRNA(Gln) amidotransferase C subunit
MPTVVQTDIKANTEIAIFQIIQPAVEDYLTTTRGKTWKMVKAAQEARRLIGDGPEPEKTVREQFKKAFLERKASPGNLTEDDEYNNNAKLVSKVVKVAFHYTEEQIEKYQKKQTSFFQLFNKIKSVDEEPTQPKAAEITDNKKPEEQPTDTPAPDKNLGALMAPKATESTGWSKTDQPRMKEFDEWHNETLAIISDQFEKRFLPTIKKAMEVELTALKKKQLISTLNHS